MKKLQCSSSKTDIKIYESTVALPASWDISLPANHDLQSNTLALYEKVKLPNIRCYYVLLGAEQKPTAFAYFQLLDVSAKHINPSALGGYQTTLAPLCLRLFKPSLLVAGHLFRHDVQNFYVLGLSPLEAFRAYEQMIQTLGKYCGAMAYLIKDVPQHLVQYFTHFAPNYTFLRNDIAMQMPISSYWQTFSDYEKSLKHKYAQKCRKVRSALRQLRIEELSVEQIEENKNQIFELYLQVSSKQAISLGLLNADFMPELKKKYPKQLKIWAFYDEVGEMIAFASAWLHESCFDMFYIGLQYNKNNKYNIYFNILYFSVEQAIKHKKLMLNLGRTALEAKARLGCTPRYLPTFLFIRNVCLRSLVNSKINQQHENEGAWEERHPFKSQKETE